MTISKFKATCLAVLERVRRTGQPVLVTRRGQPVAEVVPPSGRQGGKRVLGGLQGSGRIIGDIVEPVVPAGEWEAARG
jgi:prevent-host-death family protein